MLAESSTRNAFCTYEPIAETTPDPPMPWWIIIGIPSAVGLVALIAVLVSLL